MSAVACRSESGRKVTVNSMDFEEIAAALGPDWTVEAGGSDDFARTRRIVNHKHMVGFWTWGVPRNGDSKAGVVQWHADVPDELRRERAQIYWRAEDPKRVIGIHQSREPGAIASELSRRLLPGSLILLRKCLELREQRETYNGATEAAAAAIPEQWPAVRFARFEEGSQGFKNAYLYGRGVDVEIQGEQANIKLRVRSVDAAAIVLAVSRFLPESD